VASWLKDHPWALRTLSIVLFFALWEIVGRRTNPIFLSYPTAIAAAGIDSIRSGELLFAFLQSMVPFLIGMSISIFFGILLGLLIGEVWWAEQLLDHYVIAFNAVPRVAIMPLVILWFGLELTGKVVIVVSLAIFPVIINTYAGVKDVRGALLDIGRAYALTNTQIFFKILLPAALPFIMAGVRLAFSLGLVGMIVAEFFTAVRGMGAMILLASNNFETAKMFVPIIVLAALGIGLNAILLQLERRLAPWRLSERER
jgi:ABC-type nitrate/sulfonate/bicarbonate transport system permease component